MPFGEVTAGLICYNKISVLRVEEIEHKTETAFEAVRGKGNNNLYIHIDLDVLEPSEFPYVPLPAAHGLRIDTLRRLLRHLNKEFTIVGLGLVEYKPTNNQRFALLEEIIRLGTALS